MLSQKNDTIYRYIKTLIDKEIIEKVPKLDYYRVTQKGINYDYKSDASEINPIDVGNKSDTPSEINPIYNNTINESINEEDISPSDLV